MPKANSKPTLKDLKENFAELHPPLTPDAALAAASHCLYCYDAPCTRACPTHIDVPRFIQQILHNDALGAARTILDANVFGGSCARVCPTEVLCEGACVDHTLLKAPVQIGRLQRFACDSAHTESMDFYRPGSDTGKSVAVVGAGPAGLTCAHELRQAGHRVVVFEAGKVPGGLNTLGIAAYKITTKFALSEVQRILKTGLDLRLGKRIDGKKLAALVDEYDAVFLGIGLGPTASLGIPGEDHAGVWEALDFIHQTHTKPLNKCRVGRRVAVIGAGNTAIDVANAAVRLGAESVTMVYRRDRASMPAFEHEYELARASGVGFEWLTRPTRVTLKKGKVAGLRCVRTRLNGRGRKAKVSAVGGSEFTMAADMVVKALGQDPLAELIESVPGLEFKGGRTVVDPRTGATSVPKLFAGGDCTNGGMEVVDAVRAGKTAAEGIDRMLAARRAE